MEDKEFSLEMPDGAELTPEQQKTYEASKDLIQRMWKEFQAADPNVAGFVLASLAAIYVSALEGETHDNYTRMIRSIRNIVGSLTGETMPIMGSEFEVRYSTQVSQAGADDPQLGEFVRETTSRLQQAMQNVDMSNPQEVARMMESLGMTPCSEEEIEEIEEKLNADVKKVN